MEHAINDLNVDSVEQNYCREFDPENVAYVPVAQAPPRSWFQIMVCNKDLIIAW